MQLQHFGVLSSITSSHITISYICLAPLDGNKYIYECYRIYYHYESGKGSVSCLVVSISL